MLVLIMDRAGKDLVPYIFCWLGSLHLLGGLVKYDGVPGWHYAGQVGTFSFKERHGCPTLP